MNWPFESFKRHLINENEWLRAQHQLLQAKLDRLEAAVWAQQSPAGAAYAQSERKPLQDPVSTVSTWEQAEREFYTTETTQTKEEKPQ